MRKRFSFALRLGAVALLVCSAGVASAHVAVGIGVNIGIPAYGYGYPYGGYPYGYPAYGYPGYGTYVSGLPVGAVSVGIYGGAHYWYHGGLWYRPWGARWAVVAPPVGVAVPIVPQAAAAAAPPTVSTAPSHGDPIIYPRKGQDANQTEFDRQECNRWATTQPSAVNDAGVFQHAIEACMDARGYSMR